MFSVCDGPHVRPLGIRLVAVATRERFEFSIWLTQVWLQVLHMIELHLGSVSEVGLVTESHACHPLVYCELWVISGEALNPAGVMGCCAIFCMEVGMALRAELIVDCSQPALATLMLCVTCRTGKGGLLVV